MDAKNDIFFQTLKKIIRVKKFSIVATYDDEREGRNVKQWEIVRELDTIQFVELESPGRRILTKLARENMHRSRLSFVPKRFNVAKVARLLQDRWDDAMLDPDTVVFNSDDALIK